MSEYVISQPTPCVTIAEVKAQLRIDSDAEDALLNQYIIASTSQAELVMQREIIKRSDEEAICLTITDVPSVVKQYVLLTVGDMYAHRENQEVGTYDTHFLHLLDGYKLYGRGIGND